MLVRAALVPDTALLVPGTAGAADPVPDVARAAHAAVASLVDAAPDAVVVVASAPRRQADEDGWGPWRPTFAAAGVPDSAWTGAVPDAVPNAPADARTVTDVAAATGLVLLARAGWTGPTRLLRLRPGGDAAQRRTLGADAVRDGRVALLVLGSLSARRGPGAPLAEDPDAAGLDDAVLADLAAWDAPARARLARLDPAEAARLAVSGWTGWQVLLGATEGTGLEPEVLAAGAPLGATYVVVRWA